MIDLRDAITRAAQADTALDAALIYAESGVPVFPCAPDKRPAMPNPPGVPPGEGGFHLATTDQAQIRAWWQQYTDALIGMPTGEVIDGHFVIDQDDMDAEIDLPRTLTIKSMSDGRHYYYRAANGTKVANRNRVASGIDVSGDGGYIIVPGGVDSPYTVVDDFGVAVANANVLRFAIPDTARKISADDPALDAVFGAPPGAPTSVGSPERAAQMRLIGQMASAGHDDADIIDAALAIPEADARAERHSDHYVKNDVMKMVRTTRKQFGDLAVPFTAYDNSDCHVSDREVFPEPDNGVDQAEPLWTRQSGFALHQAQEPPGAEASELRVVSFADLVARDLEPATWLVEGLIEAGEVATIVGDSKSTKTTDLYQLLIDAGLGRPAWGELEIERPLRCGLVDEEMGQRKLEWRMKRLQLGSELSHDEIEILRSNLLVKPQCGFTFGNESDREWFRDFVVSNELDLIIIDSLAAVQPGDDEKSANQRRRFYNEVLAPVARAEGCSVIIACHPPLKSKNAPEGSQRRARGSGDILALVDRNLFIEKDPTPEIDHNKRTHIVRASIGVERERESSGGVLPLALTIAGYQGSKEPPQPLTVTGSAQSETQARDFKRAACSIEILAHLRAQSGFETIRQAVLDHCRAKDYDPRNNIDPALQSLETKGLIRISKKRMPDKRGAMRQQTVISLTNEGVDQ